MSIPSVRSGPPDPLRWRLWWRFGFTPLVRGLGLLRPVVAEWRIEQWVWHIDIWAMDHIGRRRP